MAGRPTVWLFRHGATERSRAGRYFSDRRGRIAFAATAALALAVSAFVPRDRRPELRAGAFGASIAPVVMRQVRGLASVDRRRAEALAVLCGALLGAGLGFLWFNAPPASIFMGDTGSLALGGMLGAIAVATKHEVVLGIVGGLFVLEAVSVIVQVLSFKLTGKRVFRMAPIHHHFEQLGWTEPQIVIRFWIISIVLALAGLSTLKLR